MTSHEIAKIILLKPSQQLHFIDTSTGEVMLVTGILNRPTGLLLTNA